MITDTLSELKEPTPQGKLLEILIEIHGYSDKTWRTTLKSMETDELIKSTKTGNTLLWELISPNDNDLDNKEMEIGIYW